MAIAQVGGANNNSAVGVTTLTVNYSPSNGNHVVLFINTGGIVTGLTVQDSNAVNLTAGPVQDNIACFYYKVSGSPTSFTGSWTETNQVGIALEEYSGAFAVNDFNSANRNSGNNATATITIAMLQPNNWVVCGLGSANTITGTVGNQRQQVTASTSRITLIDNTSATLSQTCTGTLTSLSWDAVGVELGGAGKAREDQDLSLVIKSPTTAKVREDQDLTLVVKSPTNTHVRVDQDFSFVVMKVVPFNQGVTTVGEYRPPNKKNIASYAQASSPVFVTKKGFPIVFVVT